MNLFKLPSLLLTTFVLTTLSSYTFSEISPPSGMEWSKSQSEIKRSGLKLSDCKSALGGDIEYCDVTGHDKPISFAESYTVYFIKGYGLHKVLVSGKNITGDAYGSEGKASYSKILSSLNKKYPEEDGYESASYEWIARELYKDSDEFYECLRYDGCGNWSSYINGQDEISLGNFSVELEGLSRGTGYLSLTYESPNWGKYLDVVKNQESSRDDEAL